MSKNKAPAMARKVLVSSKTISRPKQERIELFGNDIKRRKVVTILKKLRPLTKTLQNPVDPC